MYNAAVETCTADTYTMAMAINFLISLFSSPLQQHEKAEGHIGAEEGQYTLYCIVFKRTI